MWSARAHEDKKVCLGVKHIFISGGECKRMNPLIPKCTPTLGVALMRESWMFKTLVEKEKKTTRWGPPLYHWKGLEVRMLKVFSHCSFRPEMYELWSKEVLGVKLGIWFLTTNPLRVKVKLSLIGVCDTPWKDIFEGYKIALACSKQVWFEEDMNVQNFGTRVPILGLLAKNVIWI
jgi:hypothetical protein